MRKISELIRESIDNPTFKDEVVKHGGKIYIVGGKVRDDLLGVENKDVDMLITGIPQKELRDILENHGIIKLFNKSFDVIFFKEYGTNDEYEIVIPRTEKKIGKGYKGFKVEYDHTLPIEVDLMRRDFSINSIAEDMDGNIIDPYGGKEDLKNKIIRAVNPDAFQDDPLRMLRAVQFASRFGFTIEPDTFKAIKDNASTIKEITPDRILIEFSKIVYKGKSEIGIELLDKTKLFNGIFSDSFNGRYFEFVNVKNMGDFIYLCLKDTKHGPGSFFKHKLKGDNDTERYIKSLECMSELGDDVVNNRLIASKMNTISPDVVNSGLLLDKLDSIFNEFKDGKYPVGTSYMSVNGNDVRKFGYEKENIKKMLNKILILIYADKLKDNKNDILKYIKL